MDMKQFWNDYYNDQDEHCTRPDETLVRVVSDMKPGRALDLGAGDGGNSFWLASKGWQVTAVDFAETAVEHIAAEGRARGLQLEAEVGDILNWQPAEPVDLICLGYIHLPREQRQQLMANVARALAPGGMLLYMGITDIEAPEGMEKGLFAPLQTVVAAISDLRVVFAEEKKREIDMAEDPFEAMGVTVIAKKPAEGAVMPG